MLPKFFTAENDEQQRGAVYIIATRAPYPIGQVFRFDSVQELDNWLKLQSRPVAQVLGYNVAIAHHDYMAPAGHELHMWQNAYLQESLQLMAGYFLRTRMTRDKGYWKRYQQKP